MYDEQQKMKNSTANISQRWFTTEKKSWYKFAGVVLVGAGLGYLYYHWFGCRQSCPISGNAWLMTGFGMVMGINLGWGFIRKQPQPETISEVNSNTN